ncbi:unnamed protein product [Closterium sp. NIES-53]
MYGSIRLKVERQANTPVSSEEEVGGDRCYHVANAEWPAISWAEFRSDGQAEGSASAGNADSTGSTGSGEGVRATCSGERRVGVDGDCGAAEGLTDGEYTEGDRGGVDSMGGMIGTGGMGGMGDMASSDSVGGIVNIKDVVDDGASDTSSTYLDAHMDRFTSASSLRSASFRSTTSFRSTASAFDNSASSLDDTASTIAGYQTPPTFPHSPNYSSSAPSPSRLSLTSRSFFPSPFPSTLSTPNLSPPESPASAALEALYSAREYFTQHAQSPSAASMRSDQRFFSSPGGSDGFHTPLHTLQSPSPHAGLYLPSPRGSLRAPSPRGSLRSPSPRASQTSPSPHADLHATTQRSGFHTLTPRSALRSFSLQPARPSFASTSAVGARSMANSGEET